MLDFILLYLGIIQSKIEKIFGFLLFGALAPWSS